MAITAIPIQPVGTFSGNQYRGRRIIEESAQTFKLGTVLALAAGDGGVIAWAGVTLNGNTGSPVGISYESASNLSATGSGAPTPNSPFLGKGSAVTFGSVPNESSAVNIPHGAPFNDGRVGLFVGNSDTIFSGTFGNNGNTATPAATDVGVLYGLTIDSGSNFWYVDKNKTGASAAVRVIGLDLRDAPAAGSRVLFIFQPSSTQILG